MIRNILITGATGFIGSNIIELLLNYDYNVYALIRSTSSLDRIKEFLNRVNLLNIDTLGLEKIFKENKFDIILHLATYYKKHHLFDDIDYMIRSNVNFPVKLLDLCKIYKVPYFINTGSFFEYDTSILPVQEGNKKKPFNLYATTKLAFERFLEFYSEDVKSITLKISYPFGEKDNINRLIPTLMKAAITGEEVNLSEGFQKVDFIYVKDVAKAYIRAIENIENLNNLDTFNIGYRFPYSIREIVYIVEEISNKKINVKWGTFEMKDIQIYFPDITKAKYSLKWMPEISIREGLERTFDYYKRLYAI